ncbi:hypothetical protein Apa02nite_082210 [Actinoplanes palleronii]|uniref:Uncharacterized protein n=1 Tax=Actinoplanes palleronii TaxID=113570 RepID=A0ABQ4BN48_9ACTN|nr:hypothetical protein Apa02nite_082210 [Actinoplanes palleronii]
MAAATGAAPTAVYDSTRARTAVRARRSPRAAVDNEILHGDGERGCSLRVEAARSVPLIVRAGLVPSEVLSILSTVPVLAGGLARVAVGARAAAPGVHGHP